MTMRDRWHEFKRTVKENEAVKMTTGHISRNKDRYIIAGVSIVGTLLVRQAFLDDPSNKQVARPWKLNYKSVDNSTTIITQLAQAGHPGNIIYDPATGDNWRSIQKAADALGVTRPTIINNLRGLNTPSLGDRRLLDLGPNNGGGFDLRSQD
jgi:hypothetical protein